MNCPNCGMPKEFDNDEATFFRCGSVFDIVPCGEDLIHDGCREIARLKAQRKRLARMLALAKAEWMNFNCQYNREAYMGDDCYEDVLDTISGQLESEAKR